jgi:carbon monoxide dehydrogenase subunit G
MQHEHTEHVAAPPDAVYAVISDVSNLPSFVPQIIAARPAGKGRVEVDARYEGHEHTARRCSRPTTPHAGSSGAGPTATTVGCRSTRMGKVRG